MPEDVALELKNRYTSLPPKRIRWRSEMGQQFLLFLVEVQAQYGVRSCAVAVGVSPQSIHAMLDQKMPLRTSPWPTDQELTRLRDAWAITEERNRERHQVRREHAEFEQVHLALMELTRSYDVGLLAVAIGTQPSKLRRFLAVPKVSKKESVELALLDHARLQYQRAKGSDRTEAYAYFMSTLVDVHQRVSVPKIARAIDSTPAEVFELLKDRATE